MTAEAPPEPPILLGTTPQQPLEVLEVALSVARRSGTFLVCAQVDPMAYVVEEHPDGSVESRPVDPDRADWNSASRPIELAVRQKVNCEVTVAKLE